MHFVPTTKSTSKTNNAIFDGRDAPETCSFVAPRFKIKAKHSQTSTSSCVNPGTRVTTRRSSIRKSSSQRSGSRLLRRYLEWKNEHLYLGRYTVEKLLAFDEYQRRASPLRVFIVIMLTPLPALLIVLSLATIPLRSPLLPASANAGYFVQSWLSFSVVTFNMLQYMRCALALPQTVYSHRRCLLIAVLIAGMNELVMVILSVTWRFPIPLRDILGGVPYSLFFVLFHVLLVGRQLRPYRAQIQAYFPLYFAQVSTFFLFEGVAVVFKNASVLVKALITVLFPVLKAILKRAIRRFTHSLADISTETSFCVVEIFGSLFQNVYLQSSRSLIASALIIALDIVQGVVETRMHLSHQFIVDGRQALRTAVKIIEHSLFPGASRSDKKNTRLGLRDAVPSRGVSISITTEDTTHQPKLFQKRSKRSRRSSTIACLQDADKTLDVGSIIFDIRDQELFDKTNANVQLQATLQEANNSVRLKTRKSSIDDMEIFHRHHAVLLSQTLQRMYASEVLIFAEYSEFACALIYSVYVLVMYHMPNAKYNLPFIGLSGEDFFSSMINSGVYTILEGFTMVLLLVLIRKKFGFCSFYQLSFMLEKYWMSVQGKVVGSFTLLFILNTVHQGTDLSMKFDWEQVLKGS